MEDPDRPSERVLAVFKSPIGVKLERSVAYGRICEGIKIVRPDIFGRLYLVFDIDGHVGTLGVAVVEDSESCGSYKDDNQKRGYDGEQSTHFGSNH
jgi:hypothetical protein